MSAMGALRWALVLMGLWLVSGTALGLSHHPHWYVRGWDFPRVLIAALALGLWRGLPRAVLRRTVVRDRLSRRPGRGHRLSGLAHRRLYAPRPEAGPAGHGTSRGLLVPARRSRTSCMENDRYDLWRSVIGEADPDIVVALEVDAEVDGRARASAPDAPARRGVRPGQLLRDGGVLTSAAGRDRSPLPRGPGDAIHPHHRPPAQRRDGPALRAAPQAAGAAAKPGLEAEGRRARARREGDRAPRRRRPPWSAAT